MQYLDMFQNTSTFFQIHFLKHVLLLFANGMKIFPGVPSYFYSGVRIEFLCLPISVDPLEMRTFSLSFHTCDKRDANK